MVQNNDKDFGQGLEIIFKIFSILGIFILLWYSYETYKIRMNSENQLKISARPFVTFLPDPNPYTLVNKSNNVAQNILQISKINGQYFMADEESVGGLGPDGQIHFDKDKNIPITSDGLRKLIPDIAKLVTYLDKKQVTCLVVVYDDLFGNKLFSISYGRGVGIDNASETHYIDDL